MAFTDSGGGNPMDTGPPGSNDTEQGSEDGRGRGMTPPQQGGALMAALQRQARGPQVSAPGPGNAADALGKLKLAIDLMQTALQGFEPESRQHDDISRALDSLSPYLPKDGAAGAGLEQTHLTDLLRKGKQNPVLQALSGLVGGGGSPGPQGAQPPMPSTPLPGA